MNNRSASAKKAWETIRARKAAGLPPISSSEKPKPSDKDYSGLITAWLSPSPAAAAAPLDPAPMVPKRTPRAIKRKVQTRRQVKRVVAKKSRKAAA